MKNILNNNSNNKTYKKYEFPRMTSYISKKDLQKHFDNVYYYVSNFRYIGNDLTLLNIYKNTHINDIAFESYYNEKKYLEFWIKNKKIIKNNKYKYFNQNKVNKTNNTNKEDIKNISIELYKLYNKLNILYFETTIIALCKRYNCKKVLDVNITTYKRLIGCCIRDIKYIGISDDKKVVKDCKFYINKYGTKNQKIIKNISKLKSKYDLIFIDLNSPNSNLLLKNLNNLWKLLNKKGVLVICYSNIKQKYIKNNKENNKTNNKKNNKGNKFLKDKNYEIIKFNNQIFKIYRKTALKNKKIKNKKTYLILSKYFDKLQKYLPNNWIEAEKNTKVIDFIYVDSIFTSDKSLYKLKANLYSKGDFGKGTNSNIDDKAKLHTLVKKDNPKMFKKYFMEQHTIYNQSNLQKYKDLFKKHKYWILKPEPGGIGFGIKLFDNIKNIKKYIMSFNKKFYHKNVEKWVLQKYISNPLLIPSSNKKFHLRFYYLLTNINGKFKSYFFKKGCFYPANKEFSLNTLNLLVHMTHGSNSEKSEKGFYPEYFEELFGKKNTKKTFIKIKKLFKYINSIISFKPWSNNKNAFHFIGADIMMTEDYEVKLIELNDGCGLRPFMWFPKIGEIFQKELIDIIFNNAKNIKYFIDVS